MSEEKRKRELAERLGISQEEIKEKGIVGCAYERHKVDPLTPHEVASVLQYRACEEWGAAQDPRCADHPGAKEMFEAHAWAMSWASGFVYNMLVENNFAAVEALCKGMEEAGVTPEEFAKAAKKGMN